MYQRAAPVQWESRATYVKEILKKDDRVGLGVGGK